MREENHSLVVPMTKPDFLMGDGFFIGEAN